MVTTITPQGQTYYAPGPSQPNRYLQKRIATTYQSNTDSDYTEQIADLDRDFQYKNNRNALWSKPEQSLLYGTPLFDQASSAQKLALNHLHWFANYNYVADTETETVALNQVTASVFDAVGGYSTLAEMLDLETDQEHYHIHAFRKIGLSTANALLGKSALKALLKWHSYRLNLGQRWWPTCQYHCARSLTKMMFRDKQQYYSQFLQTLEQKGEYLGQIPTTGILGRGISPALQRFFGFNWGGGSPFLACQYYLLRMMGNMTLKNMEHPIAKYYKTLKKTGDQIPGPTAVSHYHFLDESFHTTTSLMIARDMYKDFPKPTAYEKWIANVTIRSVQGGTLGGLSGAFTHRYFADDLSLMELIYRMLQAPLFGLSALEALVWMERCLCQEHDGFHVALKNHQRLLVEHRTLFEKLDYLWPVNRDMRLMAAGGSIPKALAHNRKTFRQFSRLVATEAVAA